MASLYERLGGEAAIMATVAGFYDRVLLDDLTRPFFENLDLAALVRKQIAFMTVALEGPAEYRGRDLTAAHARLVRDHGLTDAHFDAVVRHLAATLRELRVDGELIDEVLQVIETTRAAVLGR